MLEIDELNDAKSSDSENEATAEVEISHSEAIDDVNKLIERCSQNEYFGIKHTFNLMSFPSDMVTCMCTTKKTKQTPVTEYLK